eukprot:134539-Pelagomonas_calceolata.AAC.2
MGQQEKVCLKSLKSIPEEKFKNQVIQRLQEQRRLLVKLTDCWPAHEKKGVHKEKGYSLSEVVI